MDPNYQSRPSDALVTLRQFVNAFGQALNDQSYAGTDASVYNPPGQFAVYGPYGASVEGQPITLTGNGGAYISPTVLLMLMGAAAVLLLKR